jgi:alkanesulfonate monooxygenase SsuD/methylene tetrahydromethanopterin reductase-like flavin-dependent oxidoreductase (luciferase family)
LHAENRFCNRVLFIGLLFAVFGLNGFFNFIHQPPLANPLVLHFFVAISSSHFVAFIFEVQLIGGLEQFSFILARARKQGCWVYLEMAGLLSGTADLDYMKKIGFLSFGHWTPSAQSRTQSAADALLQSIDIAIEAERLGMDGAYFRVHHFAQQLASPFPLLAAVGAKTQKIEIGTAVIDMRYENPHYMAEDASAADLIAGGRLQLGISRGSPEQVIDGWHYFGYRPIEGENDADMGRRHAEEFLELLRGKGFAQPNPRPMFPNPPGLLRLEPYSEGLRDRIWWGSASNATAAWAAKRGMNLQTSTLKFDETGEPLHIQQSAQIRAFRAAWKEAGHTRTPRISVSRSIFALLDDRDRAYFGRGSQEEDTIGFLDENTRAIFGRSYAAEPDILIEQLRKDEAIAEADTLLLTIPNQLGVAYNVHVIEAILKTVAPALGWR